ncbi:MAG: ATP-binding protein [Methylococcales bacterium]|nr:ATP-binding protein [Methylococcales bacterium]
MRLKSISGRLLLAGALVMIVVFALAGWVLERSYRSSAEQALQETLKVQIYALLAIAEVNRKGHLTLPHTLREPRFGILGSGLYAWVSQRDGPVLWHSPSALGVAPSAPPEFKPGVFQFVRNQDHRYTLHYGVIWETQRQHTYEFIFSVVEDSQFVNHQVNRFRATLYSGLSSIGLVILFMQFLVLRWSLSPLRTIGQDLAAIERGDKTRLEPNYARELNGLAGNLNALIISERAHQERYRNTLADLAHSLKTPLAILRGELDKPTPQQVTMHEQITRMNDIVEYQLQRAAAQGRQKLLGTVDICTMLRKITASMAKVYADKAPYFELNLPEQWPAHIEQGDFYEIAGNLIDNACKWCQTRVSITVQKANADNCHCLLIIEDDGPGIATSELSAILGRGVRADQNTAGHGIGMAVVNELITLLEGRLHGSTSPHLGGMRWEVYLP